MSFRPAPRTPAHAPTHTSEASAAMDVASLDAIGDLIVIRDGEGRVRAVNAAFLRAFGGARADWVGRWFALAPAGTRRRVAGGRNRIEGVVETVTGPATIEWEESQTPEGGVVLVGRDVSARAAGEAARRADVEAADAAARAKQTLFATITHELRTPLGGVLGMADLLSRTTLTGEQASYVQAISASGRHLLGLVDNVLDAAKLEAGAYRLAPAPMALASVIQEVGEWVTPRARDRGLDVAVYVDPQLPTSVLADAARLRQILLNLAGNAVKFTESGGLTINAHLERVETGDAGAARASVLVSVRDTGPGIPVSDQSRIFEAFAQVDGAASARADGAGLGLAIVARLVRMMDGDVGVESTPGAGARFWARIKVDVDNAAPWLAATGSASLHGVAVLVAGPEPLTGETVCAQIRALGGSAHRAGDKAQASAFLEAQPDTLVLVDASWAEEAWPHRARAALVLAGPDERTSADALRARGYAGWLIKPVRPEALAEHLARAWRGEAMQSGDEPDTTEPSQGAGTSNAHQATNILERAGADAAQGLAPTALLAEDNPVNVVLARAVLARLGWQVVCAGDGAAALQEAERRAFDVILMDMRMPGMDGLEATRRLREHEGPNAKTPVIALTANASGEDKAACLAAGMDAFVTKPVEEDVLGAVLARWTGRAGAASMGP